MKWNLCSGRTYAEARKLVGRTACARSGIIMPVRAGGVTLPSHRLLPRKRNHEKRKTDRRLTTHHEAPNGTKRRQSKWMSPRRCRTPITRESLMRSGLGKTPMADAMS
jgi:hypothetical protein